MRTLFLVCILLTIFTGTGCGERPGKASDAYTDPISILALGDSYTVGEGVDTDAGWPAMLRDTLQKIGFTVLPPQIVARTGWTTGELLAAMVEAELTPPYDLVSLLIGVNNQYRGASRGYHPEDYQREFSELLKQAIELSNGDRNRVVVISIPDYSVTPFVGEQNKAVVSREIDAYNQINKQLSDDAGVHYVDITPISQQAVNDHELLVADYLHPSALMYRKWVREMLPLVLEGIRQPSY